MTALAVDYRADRVSIAADSLCYLDTAEPVGSVTKVYQIPHLRAVFFGCGKMVLMVRALTNLMLRPELTTIEQAAEALPDILRRVTEAYIDRNDLDDDDDKLKFMTFCAIAGWSDAEQRMRLIAFRSDQDYRQLLEADRAYGGPYSWQPLDPAYMPLDRAADTLDQKLAGVIKGMARFCEDHPDVVQNHRMGGQITVTEVTQDEIAYRVIDKFDDYDAMLKAAIAETDPEAKSQAPTREDQKRAAKRKAQKVARKKARRK
jgi:hypothetical protein